MSMIGYFLLAPDAQIRARVAAPESPESAAFVGGALRANSPDLLDVGKAWHALHFLLTGTAWEGKPPLDFIVRGGTEIGGDVGYGPARAFSVAETRAIADALDAIEPAALAGRFDGAAMDRLEIYPAGRRGDLNRTKDDELGYFTEAYVALRQLLLRARREGLGLVTFVA